jgi:hypothetical protein
VVTAANQAAPAVAVVPAPRFQFQAPVAQTISPAMIQVVARTGIGIHHPGLILEGGQTAD